jgi:hypothetical protein
MEPTKQDNRPSDEIDLTQFFRWVGNGFTRLGHQVLYGLASLRNLFFSNRLFFAGIILIGLVLGGIYSQLLKKKFYRTSMVLSCDYLNTQILENTIEKLNLLANEEGGEGLAEELNLDLAIAKNIQRFEFAPFVSEDDVIEMEVLRTQLNAVAADKKDIVEKVISKLQIENKNAYEISAYVYNPDIVKPLETAFVNYFQGTPYIKHRMEINKANLQERRNKLERESRKLDSLKAVLFQNYQELGKTNRGSGNVFLGDEKLADPLAVFKEDLVMHQELQQIERDLYLRSDFEVVDGFTTFQEPESDSLFKTLFISFWISIAMGYLIIGAWRFDRYLARYDTKT